MQGKVWRCDFRHVTFRFCFSTVRFLGTPFLHSMLARTEAYISDIAVLMDPETVLLPDFISALNYAHELDRDWLLVSSSVDTPRFTFHWDEKGRFWRQDNGKRVRFGEVWRKSFVFVDIDSDRSSNQIDLVLRFQQLQKTMSLRSWQSTSSEGKMIMAWNNVDVPLHCGVLPPFLYQRGTHNQWIINEAMSCKRRFVFDATSTISSFFLSSAENKYKRSDNVSEHKTRYWEYTGNSHLGQLYGSLFFSVNKSSTLPKLLKCNKRYIFVSDSVRSIDPSIPEGKIGSNVGFRTREKISACISRSKPRSLKLDFVQNEQAVTLLKFPFDLESLLPLVADKNRTVVLSIAGFSYKDMLMSWVCRLRRLAVPNFLVCALDDETYQFSILQVKCLFASPSYYIERS